MCLRGGVLLLFLLPALVSLQPQSQAPQVNKPAAAAKTTVRRVLVDVFVTNDKGESVTGLHERDFEVLEDGKRQKIMTFEEHHGAAPTEVKLPPMPPHVYTNFGVTQTADSINIVLLDARTRRQGTNRTYTGR